METATRIIIATIHYEGATRDFLLTHGCQLVRARHRRASGHAPLRDSTREDRRRAR
ncbi:MAG: hypothetical protein WCD86_17950 [Ktedonobacteraceae bacterium]